MSCWDWFQSILFLKHRASRCLMPPCVGVPSFGRDLPAEHPAQGLPGGTGPRFNTGFSRNVAKAATWVGGSLFRCSFR